MDRATGNLMEMPAVPRGKLSVKPETFRLVKDALADVVTKGTATRAKSSLVTIGGKTGTAQVAALRTGPEESIPKNSEIMRGLWLLHRSSHPRSRWR